MRPITLAALVMATLVGAPAFAQSPFVGTWATVAETPQGTFEASMTVSEADGDYAVMFEEPAPAGAPPMESEISDVAVDGSSFSFKRTFAGPQGDFVLTYAGTVDGDEFTATASSDFGEVPFSGTRQ